VSGSTSSTLAGELTIMVGGEAAALDRALPVFQAMGKRVTHIGPSGHGQTAKLCNNLIYAAQMLATAEATVMATKAGVDLAQLQQLSGQRQYPVIEFEDGSVYRAPSKDMAATIAGGGLDSKRGSAPSS
jgi:3-hydroxyisobutyrate dehydrogenase-like beta-hydroxyacid dehydrogenase